MNMNSDTKSSAALLLSIIAIIISLFGGGIFTNQPLDGPDGFLKMTAKEVGMSSRAYDKCIADPTIADLVDADIADTDAIAAYTQLQGIGTPFNLIVTDTQVIPVSGAYPYEFFDLVVKTINETGTVSQDILDQFAITEFDSGIRDIVSPFNPDNDHYRGSTTPSITIIEYSDLQCPFCARVHPTFQQILNENENVTWVYRQLPLTSLHPQALPAAIASECVAREEGNDAFWQFADTVFENQDQLQ
ncbi:DsbA family protein [Patescibacteria group bacterium]|nr:DsbA family protein [Patescibacteria group bacterium]